MRLAKMVGAFVLGAAFLMAGPAAAAQAAPGNSYGTASGATGGDLPVSGDTAALIEQINRQMASLNLPQTSTATTPGISPSVQDTLDLIHNVYHANPDQLARLNALAGGMAAYGQVSNDVYGYELGLREPNGHPDY